MKVETFFEKFEMFANAPGMVGKVRELILDWAIRGRLVEQRPNDGDAATAIERFPSEVATKFARIGRMPIESEPFHVPDRWRWVRLPQVLRKLTDGTHHSPPNVSAGDFKYVTAKNIKQRGVDVSDISYVSREVHEEIFKRCDPERGDILLIKDGATTGVATINQLDEPFSMLSSVALLKPTSAICNRYLLWALRSPFYYEQTRGAMKGAAITRVNLTELAESVLPLPPLAEQKRIVAKVDELMGICDRLHAQQKERESKHATLSRAALARFAEAPTPANLEYLFHKSYTIDPADLRKSILTLAVQGKLTSGADNIDPAVSTKEGNEEGLFEIPSNWAWRQLGSLLVAGPTNGISPKAVEYETPVRSLTLTATTSGRFFGDHFKYLDVDLSDDSDVWLKDGDILVQRGNTRDYVGVAAVYRGAERQYVYPDLMMRIRLASSVLPEYAHLAMSAEPCRDFLRARASGTTGTMPKINQTTLKALPVPIPPVVEQKRIVAKVEALMAMVDRLEAQLAESRDLANRLLDAAIAELTTQGSIVPKPKHTPGEYKAIHDELNGMGRIHQFDVCVDDPTDASVQPLQGVQPWHSG